jgi:dienelactone hydrolase
MSLSEKGGAFNLVLAERLRWLARTLSHVVDLIEQNASVATDLSKQIALEIALRSAAQDAAILAHEARFLPPPPFGKGTMKRALLAGAFATFVLAFASPLSAQVQHAHPDLAFPKEASELSLFSPIAMGIWKPEGAGPFPALILVHSCGGMKQQLGNWRKEAIKRGYVVLIIDAFSSRGSPNCRPAVPIPMTRGVKDVLDAAVHLGTFAFVDKARIASVGFSWGAMAGLLAGSPTYVADVAPGLSRLAATVGLYPACYIGPFGSFRGYEYLRPDLATPTLLLLAGRDTETPAEECLSRMPAQEQRGNPLEVHLFKDATHCWDCSDQHGQRWSPPWAGGRMVVYQYESAITEQSVGRAFEFLAARLKLQSSQ